MAMLTAALMFMLVNIVPTGFMEHVEINGRVIPVKGAEWDYKADSPIRKGEAAEGVLVMRDGTEYDITYCTDYDVFTINDKFGTYMFRA